MMIKDPTIKKKAPQGKDGLLEGPSPAAVLLLSQEQENLLTNNIGHERRSSG